MLENPKGEMAKSDRIYTTRALKTPKPRKGEETMEHDKKAGDKKWQLSKVDVKERLAYLRNYCIFTDCVLIVGSGDIIETIQAHGMVLCMSSPKFEEILTNQKQDGTILILDIEPKIFHLMLDYMYLDKLEIKSTDDASMLFRAAVKYEMPNLCEVISKYMAREMTLDSVWPVLELVAETQETSLIEECGRFVRKNPSAILRHDNFLKVDQVVVMMLVDLDCLDIPELALLTAVDKWSEQKCLDLNFPPDRDNKRAVIGPGILMKLRFLTLTQEEFVKGVAHTPENSLSCILSLEESYSILMNIVHFSSYPMPVGFSNEKRLRKLSKLRCIRKIQIPTPQTAGFPVGFNTPPPPVILGSPFSTLDRVVALGSPTQTANLGGKNFCLDIKVDNPIVLYGVQVPTLWFPVQQGLKIVPKEYDESFIVTVLDPTGSPISHTISKEKVTYGSTVDINLKESVVLQSNVAYKIQVYTTNTYFLCKKMSNLEEYPPVKFTLKDSAKVGASALFPNNTGVKQSETEFGFITQIIYSNWE